MLSMPYRTNQGVYYARNFGTVHPACKANGYKVFSDEGRVLIVQNGLYQ